MASVTGTILAFDGKVRNCRVCQVFSPGKFYLQDKEKDLKLTELLEKLDDVYSERSEELQLPGSLIREGQLCVVIWPVDNHFYRATIMEAQDSHQLKMEYFDYGTVSLHTRDQLYTLVSDLQPHNYPKMAQKARLHGVKSVGPHGWDRRASETLHKLVGGGRLDRKVDIVTREEISMEHQAISDLISRDELSAREA